MYVNIVNGVFEMYGLSVASSLIFDIELICVIHSKCVLFLLKNRSGCM